MRNKNYSVERKKKVYGKDELKHIFMHHKDKKIITAFKKHKTKP